MLFRIGDAKSARTRPTRFVSILLLSCATIVAGVSAQTLDRGEIAGTVRDESGAALSGVAVTVRDLERGVVRPVSTNAAGRFAAVFLPLGRYEVRAELHGFASASLPPIDLVVGQRIVLDLVMTLAPVTETVHVQASTGRSAGLGAVLDRPAIAALPIDGRDYRDFALLAPTAHATRGTRGTFRLGGQSGDYLALHVDGADFTNGFFGEFIGSIETRNITIPLEAIQEFQVTAGGAGAELGRSNGGLVNVVTRSGTNRLTGSAAYFLRHHRLTARDAFGNSPAGLVRNQFAGSIGGPVLRDRTFYFAAADLQRQSTPLTVKFARDVGGVAVPELGIGDLSALEGRFVREEDVSTALLKIDHAFKSQRLAGRLNYSRNQGVNQGGGSTIVARSISNLETFTDEAVSLVASLTSPIGSQTFAETRFQIALEDRPREPQGEGPQIQISDTGSIGRSTVLPATQTMSRYQASGNLTRLSGRHLLKVGTDYNAFNLRNNSFAVARDGTYTFPTLERFLQRSPSLYGQYFGLNGWTAQEAALLDSVWQHEVAFYVQDQYRPGTKVTIGIGLRYDAQLNPQPVAATAGVRVPVGRPARTANGVEVRFAPVPQDIPDDVNNWEPRGDVTYDVSGTGSTILKGAVGLYYGRTPMIYFPLRGAGVTSTTIFAPPAAFGVVFPNVLPDAIASGSPLEQFIPRPAIQYVDPDFQNPRVLQVNASANRLIAAGWSVTLDYMLSESRNLRIGGFRSTLWDRNLAAPASFDEFGRAIGILAPGRPDPTITQANALASFGRGRYHALGITTRVDVEQGIRAYASYVLAKSEGNASTERDTEALLGPSDPFDLDADFGISELDVRHSFKAYVSAALPHGLSAASTFAATSGLAFPIYSATDLNGDGVTNGGLNPDRPLLDGRPAPRFPFHQPAAFMWDLRAGKRFRVGPASAELMLEVFNVLNAANRFSDPRTNAIAGRANFRELNRTLGPRTAQLGVRVDF